MGEINERVDRVNLIMRNCKKGKYKNNDLIHDIMKKRRSQLIYMGQVIKRLERFENEYLIIK